tara:strand:- start:117 stop:341 length:225 start_codon:yes stop_codon:yes gene_type:complete
MPRVTKKSTVHSITLKHINEKLDHIHKDIDRNTKDINSLKEQVAMGRGGVKVVFWLGAIIGAIFTVIKIIAGIK